MKITGYLHTQMQDILETLGFDLIGSIENDGQSTKDQCEEPPGSVKRLYHFYIESEHIGRRHSAGVNRFYIDGVIAVRYATQV